MSDTQSTSSVTRDDDDEVPVPFSPTEPELLEEEAPAKLFIGQIPRHIIEPDIRNIFEPYGEITELIVLRDKHTNTHKGCAFLTYSSRASADLAIANVHEKLSLHNRPIVVRYAGMANAPTECKLFVGMLSRETTEESIAAIFRQFGTVREVFLMRDTNNQSKGCAFVKMSTRESAMAAIQELNEIYQDEGAPRKLVVRLADSKATKQRATLMDDRSYLMQQHPMMHGAPNGPPMPWGAPPAWHMHPYFRARMPYPPPQPNQYPFYPPLPNDVYNQAAQAHAHAHAQAAYQQSQAQHAAAANFYDPSLHPVSYNQPLARGPPGANLFVYNIPDTFIDVDLQHLFSAFGTVVSTKVYRDKHTGLSRGFGFVSYSDSSSAEKSIAALNGYTVANKRLKVMFKKGNNAEGQQTSAQQSNGFADNIGTPQNSVHHQHLYQPTSPHQNGGQPSMPTNRNFNNSYANGS